MPANSSKSAGGRASSRLRCVACGGSLRPTNRFCPNCGSPVPGTPAPPPQPPASPSQFGPSLQVQTDESLDLSENRRIVTVLFADLSGSTPLGERLDPEELRRILASFFSALAREIQRFGGTVDKYIGDAIMAVFGAPLAHEDDPERAISAAVAMQAAIARLNDDLERRYATRLALRIGINTGEVVAGLLAGDVQGAYTVVGDTVNTAQRFESNATPGGILVSQSTRELAQAAFDFEELPPMLLKGKTQPQRAFRVVGARLERDRPTATSLVGRTSELERLQAALDGAKSGRGRLVHVSGEAGIGKSRLVRELRENNAEVQQVVGRCVSFEKEQAYALLARLLRDVVRVPADEYEDTARVQIEGVLEVVGVSVDPRDVALLLEVLGYAERSAFDPLSRQRVLLRLLRRLLAAYTERAPLIIVAEDLHWADSASIALLREVARDIPNRRCLLISTSRLGVQPAWQPDIVDLEALPQDGALALVEAAFGAQVDSALAETILARSGGNPFFIEEVARSLRESAVLAQQAGRVAARPGWTPSVPATVQEVLEARLDRLAPQSKRALQMAAVCGRVFRASVLHQLVPGNHVAESLEILERESFILGSGQRSRPDDATYIFRHALIQEVAYNGQLQMHRRVTHAAIGEALETIYADRLDEFVGDIAFHYGRSDNDNKALFWLVRAGERACSLYANTEALAQFRAALERAHDGIGTLDASAILERVGVVETLVGRYDEALADLSLALERLPVAVGPFVARLRRQLATALFLKGSYHETEQTLIDARVALGDENDPEAAQIELQKGKLHYRRGEFEPARIAFGTAVELGSQLGVDDLVAEGQRFLGNVAVDTGDLQAAAEHYRVSREIYERLEDMLGLADIHSNLGIIHRRTGHWELALNEYESALTLRERMGHLLGIGTVHNNIAEVHRTRGDAEQAIKAYLQAIDTWDAIGYASGVANALVGLGMARVESGDIAGGRSDLLEAQRRMETLGSTLFLPYVYRYLAMADLAEGNLDQATQLAERALEFSRAGQARHQEAATLRVLGQILLARGEPEGARALLEISRETLAKLGDALELARTEAVMKISGMNVG